MGEDVKWFLLIVATGLATASALVTHGRAVPPPPLQSTLHASVDSELVAATTVTGITCAGYGTP
jgi:hypothetical protein